MEAGVVFALRLSEKSKNSRKHPFLYGRTSRLSNRNIIINRQKNVNAFKGECTMKKRWMFLLGAAFAAELFLVVCMASRGASPRQVMYTFKDDVWDVVYRLNRRWNL